MKKTTLLLLTSVACLLTACYTTPEMDENQYKLNYDGGAAHCKSQTKYQHEQLRNCIESSIAYDDAHKKTVTIIPLEDKTLVVPKADGDFDMMDTNRVYEVVDVRKDTAVVFEEGVAPAQTTVTQTTVTVTKTTEVVENNEAVKETAEVEEVVVNVEDEPEVVEEVVIEEVIVEEPVEVQEPVVEEAPVTEAPVDAVVEVEETVVVEPALEKNEKEVLPLEEK